MTYIVLHCCLGSICKACDACVQNFTICSLQIEDMISFAASNYVSRGWFLSRNLKNSIKYHSFYIRELHVALVRIRECFLFTNPECVCSIQWTGYFQIPGVLLYFQSTGLDFLRLLLPTAPLASFLPVPSTTATNPCFAVGILTAYIHLRNQLAAGPLISTLPPNVDIVASSEPSVIISPRLRNLKGNSFDFEPCSALTLRLPPYIRVA